LKRIEKNQANQANQENEKLKKVLPPYCSDKKCEVEVKKSKEIHFTSPKKKRRSLVSCSRLLGFSPNSQSEDKTGFKTGGNGGSDRRLFFPSRIFGGE